MTHSDLQMTAVGNLFPVTDLLRVSCCSKWDLRGVGSSQRRINLNFAS